MADLKEKTYVEDVDRSVYDIRDAENDAYRMESGLTPEIVEKLSTEKDDPVWMQQFRLESLQIYNEMKIPNWGPSIEGLDMDHIATYVRPNTKMRNDWKDVPEDIKETFERLGIPQAERKSLAGVGAQYDSELVYHNVKDSVAAEGVVYTDMESAIKGEYADMVRKYFMKLVTPHDHKFAALHGAVWSGGSFVYVPKGVHLSIPLQSYFRLNAKGAGQFEPVSYTHLRAHEPALYRGLLRAEVQRGEPPCRMRGAVRQEGGQTPLLDDRKLVEEHVQPEYQACAGGRGRHDRVDLRLLRLPCWLPVPHEHLKG